MTWLTIDVCHPKHSVLYMFDALSTYKTGRYNRDTSAPYVWLNVCMCMVAWLQLYTSMADTCWTHRCWTHRCWTHRCWTHLCLAHLCWTHLYWTHATADMHFLVHARWNETLEPLQLKSCWKHVKQTTRPESSKAYRKTTTCQNPIVLRL